MIKQHLIQNSFSSGEISPWLHGRNDLEQYLRGAEVVENFDVRVTGGLDRRPGTRRIGLSSNQDSSKVVRLQEFAYSRDDAMCVEIVEGFFYFYLNGVSVGSKSPPPQNVPGAVPFGVAHTYLSAHINELQFAQSADVLFITHPLYPIHTLSRFRAVDPDAYAATNAGAWTWDQYNPIYGPYIDQNPGDENTSLSLTSVVDKLWLTSSGADYSTLGAGDWVEYEHFGQKFIGKLDADVSGNDAYNVLINPFEERCILLNSKIHSPGRYTGWNSTSSVPGYTSVTVGGPVNIAFSATSTVTQEMVGNYLRFMTKGGLYYWMLVTGVDNILEQGAYGIIAVGTVLDVNEPHFTSRVTRRNRTITGNLTSSDSSFFVIPRDSDRLFRCVYDNEVVHCRCTQTGSGTYQTITVEPHRPLPISSEGSSLINNGVTTSWNKGAFYTGNYPRAVSFHEGRLVFASTTYEPQRMWFSRSADYINFAATNDNLEVTDAAAINLVVDSNTVNEVMWLSSRTTLLAGTSGGEWNITGSSIRDPITPTTASARNQSAHGSEYLEGLTLGMATLFLQRGGNTLRQIVYSDSLDQYEALDLTVFSNHILRNGGGAIDITYQRLPEPRIILPLATGEVAVMVYEPDQQVYAWSRYKIGGGGSVVSATTVRGSTSYDIYFVVERTNNSVFTRTVEYIQPESTVYMDYYMQLTSTQLTNAIGQGWVQLASPYEEGDVVKAVIDGSVSDYIVDSQKRIYLDPLPASNQSIAYVGFNCPSILQSLPLNPQGTAGTSTGKPKRINRLGVKVKSSSGFKYGLASSTDLYLSPAPTLTAPFVPSQISGDVRCDLRADFDSESAYIITQDEPLPLSILSVMPEVTEYN